MLVYPENCDMGRCEPGTHRESD